MIDLYYDATPNGHKMTMFLEESGLAYRIIPVDIDKGEQFRPEFLALSPNNKIPAMVDRDPQGTTAPVSLFESGIDSIEPEATAPAAGPGAARDSAR